jgi:hypothetical protein
MSENEAIKKICEEEGCEREAKVGKKCYPCYHKDYLIRKAKGLVKNTGPKSGKRKYKKRQPSEKVKPNPGTKKPKEDGRKSIAKLIDEECRHIAEVLKDKNRRYGNSALEPKRLFSKVDTVEQLNVRLDDKLSRIEAGQLDDDEDPEFDIIGYLILKRIQKKNGY